MIDERIEILEKVESEFKWLMKNDRKNWVKVAKLLHQVEMEKLYELKARSFTQYVAGLSQSNNVNISTLWRARSAASVYMEIVGLSSIDEIEPSQIKTTPEQLELYGKVRTIAPEKIVLQLKEQMMAGEGIRHELKALWKTYRPLKHGKTERGRKRKVEKEYMVELQEVSQFNVPFSETERGINYAIEENRFPEFKLDEEKRRKYLTSKTEIAYANIENSLRASNWLDYTLKQSFVARHRTFTKIIPGQLSGEPIEGQGNKIDVVAIARPKSEEEARQVNHLEKHLLRYKKPVLFGASIRVNMATFQSSAIPLENAEFCNYYYIAIPLEEDFIDIASQKTPRSIGIVGIANELTDTKHQMKIIRRARFHEISPEKKSKIIMELLLNGMAW